MSTCKWLALYTGDIGVNIFIYLSIGWPFRPWWLGTSFCILLNFQVLIIQAPSSKIGVGWGYLQIWARLLDDVHPPRFLFFLCSTILRRGMSSRVFLHGTESAISPSCLVFLCYFTSEYSVIRLTKVVALASIAAFSVFLIEVITTKKWPSALEYSLRYQEVKEILSHIMSFYYWIN